MSVMVVQAQAAEAALPSGADISQQTLGHVVATGRASLSEMRRLLGTVQAASAPSLDPQPGVAAFPTLVNEVRQTGTAPPAGQQALQPVTAPPVHNRPTAR
jgi:Histidine kinase